MLSRAWLPLVLLLPLLASCGWRTGLSEEIDASVPVAPVPMPEACNSSDDDLDGSVDEDFRDEEGRYIDRDHCGGCGMACAATRPNEVETLCTLIEGSAACAATLCAPGFVPSSVGRCVEAFERLCMPCVDDGDCGDLPGTLCEDVGGELRCTTSCEQGCPSGHSCVDDRCRPTSGSCVCQPGDSFDVACRLEDPDGLVCPGSARCDGALLSECEAPIEACDEADNDCDGVVDEGFRDDNGAYLLDIRHCGRCGVDCTLSSTPEGDLKCGGDPFAPRCVLECPDELDGREPGDRVDGDGDIATGCECTISSVTDAPGPVGVVAELLDVNCDGADGVVLESFYVATDGDDAGPGSPTMPLRSVNEAIERAAESLLGPNPRPHVFVASGSYVETVVLRDGVKLHGGYRRDFRALDPNGFRVELVAPSDTDAFGGAALVAKGVGSTETVVEWMAIRGADAGATMRPAFGVALQNPGIGLILRENEIRAGVPASGPNGLSGAAGPSPSLPPGEGAPPRGAAEDATRACIVGESNTVSGGAGGVNLCGGENVSGGMGGSPSCPSFASFQPSGDAGRSALVASGGAGGRGGQDSEGPVVGFSCPTAVCCGLADFIVPSNFVGPESGEEGQDGVAGVAGSACDDPFGDIDMAAWLPFTGSAGTAGSPGAGGGGGGAGGGAEMDWMAGVCEFADGLGGGGGGGGGGGCGGAEGQAGTSGAPSAAIVIHGDMTDPALPTIERNVIAPSDGGRGGDGGAGGGGGVGGIGAFGGELPREDRSIPTLAGPFPGGRGGQGGKGGSGGGGGGGCGGGSIGVWLHDMGDVEPPSVPDWRAENTFRLGRGGAAGSGGGGDVPAPDGQEGGAHDVLVH